MELPGENQVITEYNFVNEPILECFDETVWAAQKKPGQTRFVERGNWGTYIEYTLSDGTKSDPMEYPLFAGQHIRAGTLLVYDDNNSLHVKYVIEGEDNEYMEGMCGSWTGLTEYHLHVAQDPDGFAGVTTRQGNPIPGQFDYRKEYDEKFATTGWIKVDLGELDGKILIAAHGVAWWCGYDCDLLAKLQKLLDSE